jgi:hypothetical protein
MFIKEDFPKKYRIIYNERVTQYPIEGGNT